MTTTFPSIRTALLALVLAAAGSAVARAQQILWKTTSKGYEIHVSHSASARTLVVDPELHRDGASGKPGREGCH
jgi:hypothetical protein